ncbi:hypothetical protein ACTFIW_012761 [Dictyostelium discoideum]
MTTLLNHNNNNSLPIQISQQHVLINSNQNESNQPSPLFNSISPQKKLSPTLNSTSIPPPPPSSSSKYPLELSEKGQICNLKINLDKSYFTNGETISGKVNILLTERQCIKRVKLQLCGYEKIFQHAQHSNNTYQTFKFYSGNLNIPPLNVNIETTSLNSLPISNSENNSPILLPTTPTTTTTTTSTQNSTLSPTLLSSNLNLNSKSSTTTTSTGMMSSISSLSSSFSHQLTTPIHEFESGVYEYPFSFQLPKYLAPSLNYIGYLSIFYLVHCKVDYSKGRDWKDQKVMKSSELWISGINKQYQDYLLYNKTHFTSHKLAHYLNWLSFGTNTNNSSNNNNNNNNNQPSTITNNNNNNNNNSINNNSNNNNSIGISNNYKSNPIEMAICLRENNCYIGSKATFFIQLKNPLNLKINSIRVELFQQISFIKTLSNSNSSGGGGGASSNKNNNNGGGGGGGIGGNDRNSNIQKSNKKSSGSHRYHYRNNSSEHNIDKTKVSQTQILLHNYDCRELFKNQTTSSSSSSSSSQEILCSTNLQILIPFKIEDDQVFPTTRGFLSTVKHFFIISIPSISNFKLKVPVHLWQRFDDNNFTTISNNIHSLPFHTSNSFGNIRNSYSSSGSGSGGGSNSNSNHSSSNYLNEQEENLDEQQQQQQNYDDEFYDDEDEDEDNDRFKLNPPKEWKVLWLPKWKDESSITNCNLCDNTFTIIRRTHHCRACGGVFCEACSNQKVCLYGFGVNNKVRICLMCFDAVKAESSNSIYASNINNSILPFKNGLPLQNVFSKKKLYKPPYLVHL